MKKNLLQLLGILFIFSSCGGTQSHSSFDKNLSDRITQRYFNVRSSAPRSAFSAQDRIVEFEYNKNGQIIQRVVTGFNEGPLLTKTAIVLDGRTIMLNATETDSKTYVNTTTSTTSSPVNSTRLVNVPATTETVVKADGSHEIIQKPATTKTVTVTDYVDASSSHSASQLYNESVYQISQEQRNQLLNSESLQYTLYTGRDSIRVKIYGRQFDNLKAILK